MGAAFVVWGFRKRRSTLPNRVRNEKSSRTFELCAAPNANSGTFGAASTPWPLRSERSVLRTSVGLAARIRIFDIAVYSRVFRILRECAFAPSGLDVEWARRDARIRRGHRGKKIRKVVDTKKMRG
jgi:hypothetical protein